MTGRRLTSPQWLITGGVVALGLGVVYWGSAVLSFVLAAAAVLIATVNSLKGRADRLAVFTIGASILPPLALVNVGSKQVQVLALDVMLALWLIALARNLVGTHRCSSARSDVLVGVAWSLAAFVGIAVVGLVRSTDAVRGIAIVRDLTAPVFVLISYVAGCGRARRSNAVPLSMVAAAVVVSGLMFVSAGHSGGGILGTAAARGVALAWGGTNYLAAFLVLAAPVSFAVLADSRLKPWARVLGVLGSVGCILGVALSGSRGGLVSLLVALLLLGVMSPRRGRTLGSLALAGLLLMTPVAATLLDLIVARAESASGASTAMTRLQYWQVAWSAFVASPVVGAGAGSFTSLVEGALGRYGTLSAHNLPLSLLSQVGAAGSCAYASMVLEPFRHVWAFVRARSADGIYVACVAGLAGGIAHSMVERTIEAYQLGVWWWLLLAWLAASAIPPGEQSGGHRGA